MTRSIYARPLYIDVQIRPSKWTDEYLDLLDLPILKYHKILRQRQMRKRIVARCQRLKNLKRSFELTMINNLLKRREKHL